MLLYANYKYRVNRIRHELDIYTVYVLKVQNRMNEYTTSNRQRKLTAEQENEQRRIQRKQGEIYEEICSEGQTNRWIS